MTFFRVSTEKEETTIHWISLDQRPSLSECLQKSLLKTFIGAGVYPRSQINSFALRLSLSNVFKDVFIFRVTLLGRYERLDQTSLILK